MSESRMTQIDNQEFCEFLMESSSDLLYNVWYKFDSKKIGIVSAHKLVDLVYELIILYYQDQMR